MTHGYSMVCRSCRWVVFCLGGVLFAEWHQKPTKPRLELIRERGRGEIRLLDGHTFEIADAQEDVAAKVRIDRCLHRQLDLPYTEACGVFLGRCLW
jgi:hypothetical protein